MKVTVVNVRNFPCRAPLPYIYVGRAVARASVREAKYSILRAHPLANPFRIELGQKRGATLERYRDWLQSNPSRTSALLDLLAAEVILRRLPLGCWCAPKPCHADILAELIQPIVDRVTAIEPQPPEPEPLDLEKH